MHDQLRTAALAAAMAALIGFTVNGSVPILWVAFLLPIVALSVAAHLRTHRFLPLAALASVLAPLPVVVPVLLPVGGRSLFVADLVLPAVAVWALSGTRPARGPDRAVAFYALVVLALALVGILRGAGPSPVIQDLRGPVYLVCGYVIASRRLGWGDRRAVLGTVGAILWWSVAVIALTLASGQELLHGRVGQTSAFVGDGKESLEAVRFLIASKELALVAALGTIAVLLLGVRTERPRRLVVGLLIPGAVVVFMGFSRQSVVATAAGILYVVLASPLRTQTVVRVFAGAAVVVVLLGVLGLAGITGRVTGDDTVLGRQIDAYSARVVSGLFGENVTEDPGNRFRTMENAAAMDFARSHPFAGAGLGMPYRGDLELEAFRSDDVDYGRRYVHNVYLWYAAHGGALGLLAIAVLVGRPLVTVLWPAFRRGAAGRGVVLASGAPYVALLVIGLVEPVIHTNASAPLMGAFLGFYALVETGAVAGATAAPAPTASAA